MKKFFLFVLAFCSMSVFAQTNLFDASTATLESWFGDAGWGQIFTSTASYDAATGTITCTLDQAPHGQWHAQLKLTHNVTFTAGNYYRISCTFNCSAAAAGITIKADDNTGMLFANQSVNAPAGNYVFNDTVLCNANGNNKILVFDLGNVANGVTVAISNIIIEETEAPVPTTFDGCGETFVASSGNAAAGHDGNTGTRWESSSSDPQYWQWNMAEAQTFNRIKIVWEGAYAKTFNIKAGNSCDNLTVIASVENQSLAGFPYTQIIELANPVTASSIQFEGLERGTNYGYSFWEFDVYEAQTPILSGLTFTAAATVCKVGENVALTATPKDQYDQAMAETVTYTVTPAAAGHVTAGVYTADAAGLATITATCGAFNKQVTIFNYVGENVALHKTVTADPEGFNDVNRLVDGNNGTEWQGSATNGTSDALAERTFDAGFVLDLGAFYSVSLIDIFFEGACSQAYTVSVSADNVNWNLAYTYVGTNGINGRHDYLYAGADWAHLTDNEADLSAVRYVKFHSTIAATQWGMKIFEIKVFGVEAEAPVYVRTVTAGNYGTICLAKAATLEGATAYEIVGKTANSIVLNEVANLVAGVPYIFEATADALVATLSGEAVAEAGSANGLVGSFEGTNVAEGMYVLTNNTVKACGTGCTIAANRAYINLANVPAATPAPEHRVIAIVEGTDVATALDASTGSATVVEKMVVNGQLVIIKNGVRYNALGQVVK